MPAPATDGGDGSDDAAAAATADAEADAGNVDGPLAVTVPLMPVPVLHNTKDILPRQWSAVPVTRQLSPSCCTDSMRDYWLFGRQTN